ncbi:MAG: glycosyltransferase [Clostridia bacterium]
MQTKFSIITPTYNRANFICKAIESVLQQTEADFEYLIIDDGSTDQTKEVIAPYLTDSRIQYIYQENQGEPSAVNHGWTLAQGKYFLQLNSDDTMFPELLKTIGQTLDKNPDAVLAYCDFQFIDEKDGPLLSFHNPDWDYAKLLSAFNCAASAPCTTIKRSKLLHWKILCEKHYRYIHDVEMYWNMAPEGTFVHIPRVLANRREHSGQILHERHQSIPEIEDWFERYFSRPDLPQTIKDCRAPCKESLKKYYKDLLLQSNLPPNQKREEIYRIQKKLLADGARYINLQVGDNDLIGNKFNGHNLHLLLQKEGIQSIHLVTNQQSKDASTFRIPTDKEHNYAKQMLFNHYFQLADIVHLHLLHNTNFDMNYLPLLTSLKPTVLTLHDRFFLGGHCVHGGDCNKYQTVCCDCEHLDQLFPIKNDISAYYFEKKRLAIQNSNISVIVASKWMEESVKSAPTFAGKKIYFLPFGIDQTIFKPVAHVKAKQKLNIASDSLTIMFLATNSIYKGFEIVADSLRHIQCKNKITLLAVGEKGLLGEFEGKYDVRDFGWIMDDEKLAELYQACDLFLMPSKQEAFGMMAIEAMSCGKPVLSIPGTALCEVISSPDCGLAVEPCEYTDTMQRWIDNAQEREERGRKCLAFACEHYSIAQYVQGMLKIYDDVMKRFVPSPNAAVVLSQLNLLDDCMECDDFSRMLYRSRSWRITKPIRALQHARHAKVGFFRKLAVFKAYLHSTVEDQVPDKIILDSRCWHMTRLLRAIRNK